MKIVGVGTRVLNFLIDTLVILILAYVINKINYFYIDFWGFRGVSYPKIFAAVLFVYYLISEGFFGKSIGKKVTYTVVLQKSGQKANFLQIVIRSLIRLIPIDFAFIPFTGRTLHDIVSITYIVEK